MQESCYNILEFCKYHKISRAMLYKLWKMGLGPKKTKVGRKTIISMDAAQDWLKTMEKNSN